MAKISNNDDDSYLALWFTPQAIKDHFDGDEGISDFVDSLDDKTLRAIGEDALTQDTLYREFHRLLLDGVLDAANEDKVIIPGFND